MGNWPTSPNIGDIYVTNSGTSFTYTSQGSWRAYLPETSVEISEVTGLQTALNQKLNTSLTSLVLQNPGVGTSSKIEFTKTNDKAGIEVNEYASDKTSYVFYMSDNPDTPDDYFQWRITDWKGSGGTWVPLDFRNLRITVSALSTDWYGGLTLYNTNRFEDNGTVGSYASGNGAPAITIDVSNVTGTYRYVYYCVVTATGTVKTYSGVGTSTISELGGSGTAVAVSEITPSGAAQTIHTTGVTVTFPTSGLTSGMYWTFSVWPAQTMTVKGSAVFEGSITAPTATAGNNTTLVATTAFVTNAVSSKAPIASPTLTGTPAAPTATVGTNTTQIATTAFVTAALTAQTHANATTSTSGFMSSTDKVKLDGMNSGKSLPQLPMEPGSSGGSRRYMRLATVNGVSATQGAAIIVMMANAGDYGTPRRGTSIIHFTERNDVVNVQAFQLDHENIQDSPTLYTVRTGLYQYELWGLFADYNHTLYLYPLSVYNGVITGDSQTITAPANLSTATVYQNDIWHEGNLNPSLLATLASPALTGVPTAPTAAAGTNTAQLATTAFVTNAVTAATGGAVTIASITGLQTALDDKAPLASPALTGTPTAPTAAAGTNTTQVATTAFVKTAVTNLVASAPAALDTLNELATALGNDANFASTMTTALAAKAPLASPTFTGVPAGPTATAGTNTTQLATTAFVKAAIQAAGGNAVAQTTAPSSPLVGDLWFNTTDDILYIYVPTGGGSSWLDISTASVGGSSGGGSTSIDPWAAQPIGAIIHLDVGEGITPPPTDKAYRYIDLTAGLTGAGGYNNGVLTSESVSGSSPDITATAVVSLAGSPLNGQTIRLLNTERRFIRPGSAGTLEDSQNLNHNHGGNTGSNGAQNITLTTTYGAGNAAQGYVRATGSYAPTNPTVASIPAHSHTISGDGGPEARPRNIGVKLYRRIK